MLRLDSFSSGNPAQILVIDDEAQVGQLFTKFLEDPSLKVTYMDHPQKAWQMIDKHRFDVIVTDLKMPLIGGYEFIDIVRTNALNKDVPIILCSGHIDKVTYANLSLVNKIHYLNKPFTRQELLDKVASILKIKRKTVEVDSELGELFLNQWESYLFSKVKLKVTEKESTEGFAKENLDEMATILTWSGDSVHLEVFVSIQEKAFLEITSRIQGVKFWHIDEDTNTLFYEFMDGLSKRVHKTMQERDETVRRSSPVMLQAFAYTFFGPSSQQTDYRRWVTDLGPVKIRISTFRA